MPLLVPFVVFLTNPNGIPIPDGESVTFTARSPSGADVSHLLSNTTDLTGNNGFSGQAQTTLTLGNEIGTYVVQAEWNGKIFSFSAETAIPGQLIFTNERFEPLPHGQIMVGIAHMRLSAVTANTTVNHMVGVRLTSARAPQGLICALFETFPGSGIYEGSVKTELLGNGSINSAQISENVASPTDFNWAYPDGDEEYCSADYAGEAGSDFTDSNQFRYEFSSFGDTDREAAYTPNDGTTYDFTPSFLQAAGLQEFTVYSLGLETTAMGNNQADFFYISTHGLHDDNVIFYPGTDVYGPGIFQNKWKDDLDIVFLAGCSVLDVTGDKWPSGNRNRPGKAWASLGPCFLLGYEAAAPGDSSGIPAEIMADFSFYWEFAAMFGPPVTAWMDANGDHSAWNACAIYACHSPKVAYHWVSFFGSHQMQSVVENDW